MDGDVDGISVRGSAQFSSAFESTASSSSRIEPIVFLSDRAGDDQKHHDSNRRDTH
jgi:hypothetical protein